MHPLARWCRWRHAVAWCGQWQTPVKALKRALLEVPPAVMMVDGRWGKIASPTGVHRQDTQGRQRAVKRTAKRVGLSALGRWDDGHGDSRIRSDTTKENGERARAITALA
jgi:hypothetical protein